MVLGSERLNSCLCGVCLGRVRGDCGEAWGCHHRGREGGSQSSTVLSAAVQIVIFSLGGAGTNAKHLAGKQNKSKPTGLCLPRTI